MPEKKEGAEMTCLNCQTDLICRLKDYGGDYKPKLQWQNFDGTAHYKTNDGKNFECVIPDDEDNTITQESTVETTTGEPLANNDDIVYIKNKVDLMFAMISEQFHDYQERKSQ